MQVQILHQPAYSLAEILLTPGESIVAESGAMVSMSPSIEMTTSSRGAGGGIMKGLKRAVLGGESFFLNTFSAHQGPGEVTLAPMHVGDIFQLELASSSYTVQSTSYLASVPSIVLDTQWQGAKGFFSGEGLFMLKAAGNGMLLINAFGAVHPVDVNGTFVVDTGHIVAFEDTLHYSIERVGGWFSTFFSGEGLVARFSGRGRLYIQSRNPKEFGKLVGSKLPPRD
ncbi:MAG: TIGR00266 family protein [Planctomycetes bacterium]|nr:TIGR00266 family protein [Planctomycetota bacterium]